METGILDPEKDVEKVQFQQELGRWFESRGIIANLRSHLRHLMITALQSTQAGAKATDGSSPKAQALNLMVAEYLFRHKCHYALSVFTSEVPTLANFNFGSGPQGSKQPKARQCFQENDVEEIFNALGLSSRVEELALLKRRYFEKGNDTSLIELFLQTAFQMATKLQIHENLESVGVEGERLLSKQWSSKIVDILSAEKMSPSQMSALEESISRITEREMRRAVAEERRLQMQILAEREKRIQEYFKKHEDEIFSRLNEAEKVLNSRKEVIEEELSEREKHLTKMAFEWSEKHQEILRLSRKFHNIENENKSCKKKIKELEGENKVLKSQEETQTRTIQELQGEMNLLINKLKEITDSNTVLHDRIQVLINRESKEVTAGQDGGNKKSSPLHSNVVESEDKILSSRETNSDSSESEDSSLSSSLGDIIHQVKNKLKVLEEESNRLNQNYLEYKIKLFPEDSDFESQEEFSSVKSQQSIRDESPVKEAKSCQTNVGGLFDKIQKLKEGREEKLELNGFFVDASKTSPTKPTVRTPTKRQLLNRNFFLDRRHLLQELERRHARDVPTSPSVVEDSEGESPVELTESSKKGERESPGMSSMRESPNKKPSSEGVRKTLLERTNQISRSDKDCLALLDEARRKSPQTSARKPLRQQMLMSESEKEEEKEEEGKIPKSSRSNSIANVSFGRKTGSDGFW